MSNQESLPDYLHLQLVIANDPTRLLLEDGRSYRTSLLKKECRARMSVIFLRNDEWSLGAVPESEAEAYNMWKDNWVGFVKNGEYRPISEYAPVQ